MTADEDPTASPFEGTEEYYAEHRPSYGEKAIQYLRERFELNAAARVLDLGCGAGQIAIPLAPHVGEVVGVDPNEAMLHHARKRASGAGVENVEWVVGSDADLREGLHEEVGTVRLTTMGRSFHWMDQGATLDCLYRPSYGEKAIQYLRERFELNDAARVLDLGCGAGQIAIPLAPHVGEVVGVDPNEAMLHHARKRASGAGVENVEWVVGSDADLREGLHEEVGTVRLTTMGRSFHWMDQGATLDCLYRLTEPGGGVALLNDTEWLTKGVEDWQTAVYDLASEYLDDLPERTGPVEEYDDPWHELLEDHGFTESEVRKFEVEREWTVDGVVGYVFSLSFCSSGKFGDEKTAFEADLRERLNDCLREREGETFPQTAEIDVTSGLKPAESTSNR